MVSVSVGGMGRRNTRTRTVDLLEEVLLTLTHDIVQVQCSSRPHEDRVQQLHN